MIVKEGKCVREEASYRNASKSKKKAERRGLKGEKMFEFLISANERSLNSAKMHTLFSFYIRTD